MQSDDTRTYDSAEVAYKKGVEAGRQQKFEQDLQGALELLERIGSSLSDHQKWRTDYDQNVMKMLVPALEKLLEHSLSHVTFVSAIEANQFGIRSLLDQLSTETELQIHISESMFETLEHIDTSHLAKRALNFICDAALAEQDFEIRWQNGGIIMNTNSVTEHYQTIFAAYKS